jgi:histidine triad (HIT) family protein
MWLYTAIGFEGPIQERHRIGIRLATTLSCSIAGFIKVWIPSVTTSAPCVFCEILAGRIPAHIVFNDAEHAAFFPLEHINPGHLVVVPRRHVDYIFDMDTPSYQSLWAVAAKLAPELQSVTSAKRVAVAVEGFSVPHVHVHLVPVYAGDELNPARAKPLAANEANRLRNALHHAFSL